MRNDLNGRTKVIPAPLLGNHVRIDPPGGEVVVSGHGGAHEALIVTQVQVRFGAVVGDEHLAVLKRTHGPGVHIDVGIEFQHAHLEAPGLENSAQRRGGYALSQRGNNTAGNEYIA